MQIVGTRTPTCQGSDLFGIARWESRLRQKGVDIDWTISTDVVQSTSSKLWALEHQHAKVLIFLASQDGKVDQK
jgi:peroxiredoxin